MQVVKEHVTLGTYWYILPYKRQILFVAKLSPVFCIEVRKRGEGIVCVA